MRQASGLDMTLAKQFQASQLGGQVSFNSCAKTDQLKAAARSTESEKVSLRSAR